MSSEDRGVQVDERTRVGATPGTIFAKPRPSRRRRRCQSHLSDEHWIEVGDLQVWSSLPPNNPDIGNAGWWHSVFCMECAPLAAVEPKVEQQERPARPKVTSRELTQDELRALLVDRYGEDPMRWAFMCPACGDVATGQDFRDALAEHPITRADGTEVTASARLGQECIGRTLGHLRRDREPGIRGCDWAAFGLISGPWFIVQPDGKRVGAFPVADVTLTDGGAR